MAFIVIVCFPGCDINFENNLTFIIKTFFHTTKKVKYFKTKRAFIEANKTNFFGRWEADFKTFPN